VHGLYLNAYSTWFWQKHLVSAGYDAQSFGYPSIRNTLVHNAKNLAETIKILANDEIHCVGHSLGGLVMLHMLRDFSDQRIKRIVLVGPPYQRAHVPVRLASSSVGRFIMGKAMNDWIAHEPIPPANTIQVGVIAGDKPIGLGRLVAPGIPKPHDGTVAVAETKVPGMADRIVLPVTHTQMLFSSLVMKQMDYFLRNGKFEHMA
jgi:pimeloyl-ACP methyl ester carboxylesterase